MAQIHFQPPDPLDFKNPEDWPRWKQRFEQFRVASGLVDQDAKKPTYYHTLVLTNNHKLQRCLIIDKSSKNPSWLIYGCSVTSSIIIYKAGDL